MIQRKRHLAKALTWRFLGTLDTFIIAWWLTGSPTLGVTFSAIELVSKTIMYYLHERAWYRTKWGVVEK